jgi:hypothetical protein
MKRVMSLAQKSKVGGHFSVICQKTVRRGRLQKTPEGEMPIIDTPFQRIAFDLKGSIWPVSE